MSVPWQETVNQELAEEKQNAADRGQVGTKMDAKGRRDQSKREETTAGGGGGTRRQTDAHHGYQRTHNLRIERQYVTVEYRCDERWSRDEWMTRSEQFEAPSGNVRKWFTDSNDWSANRDVIAKICICGDASVGKTSYTQRYVNRTFSTSYKWTVGVDFALKVVKWTDNVSIKLQLWDIAGQERFTSMTRVYYKDAHACIIMFDLTQRSTFENALKWKKDLDSKCTLSDGSPVPCILLANKCDLSRREIDQTEIEDFCKEQNFIGWTETSVLQNQMIEESMNFLLEEMMKKRGEWENSHEEDDLTNSTNIKLRRASTMQKDNKKCGC